MCEYVTEENIGQFTIFDVVLPTPGHDVRYPHNELMQCYTDLMAEDGLDPSSMQRNIK